MLKLTVEVSNYINKLLIIVNNFLLLILADSDEEVTYIVPGTVREEFPPRRTLRPVIIPKKPNTTPALKVQSSTIAYTSSTPRPSSNYGQSNTHASYEPSTTPDTSTYNIQNVIQNAHPQDNEISDSVNIRHNQSPNVNVPISVDNTEQNETKEAKLNLGAIVALGAFGGFVFLAAVITTIVILVRRYVMIKM